MCKSLAQVMLITLMLIAFIGQTLAFSAMSCEMSMKMSPIEQLAQTDHIPVKHYSSSLAIDTSKAVNKHTQDCCDNDCVCPTNACTTTTALFSSVLTTAIYFESETPISLPTEQPNAIYSSLFRPPIFA